MWASSKHEVHDDASNISMKVKALKRLRFRSPIVQSGLATIYFKVDEAQCPRRFLGRMGQIPSVAKLNRLQIAILCFFFSTNLRYIP